MRETALSRVRPGRGDPGSRSPTKGHCRSYGFDELVDAGADGGFGHLRVAEQEGWRAPAGAGSVVGHRLELHAPVAGFLPDRLLVDAVGQLDGDMQPGGDPG